MRAEVVPRPSPSRHRCAQRPVSTITEDGGSTTGAIAPRANLFRRFCNRIQPPCGSQRIAQVSTIVVTRRSGTECLARPERAVDAVDARIRRGYRGVDLSIALL